MKRKWIWALAVLPLVAGLIVAGRLADNRPRLVAHLTSSVSGISVFPSRAIHATDLFISPDGKRIFVRYIGEDFGEIVDLTTGSVSQMPDTDNVDFQYNVLFSADSRYFYQVSFCSPTPSGERSQDCQALLSRDARSGVINQQFVISNYVVEDFYGIALDRKKILLRSRAKAWLLNFMTLQVVGSDRKRGTFKNVRLCTDNKTIYSFQLDQKYGITTVQFFDLQSEKLLWQMPLEGELRFTMSSDGLIVLSMENGVVIARDLRTGQVKWRFSGPRNHVLAVSPDQSAIYEARENGELWKWPR